MLESIHISRVCAVIVTYFPDAGFNNRVQILLPQVNELLIVDNTPGIELPAALQALPNHIRVLRNKINMGIGTALNKGLDYALKRDCAWLLTLDQDTVCYPDIVTTLLDVRASCQPEPGIIGGNYLDLRTRRLKVPDSGDTKYILQKTVITSGCLVNTAMATKIGGFREDYFIDQIDHEFCLRARTLGYTVVISSKAVMEHSVGEAGGARLPILHTLPYHSALRKYYIARNSLITVRDYWRKEPAWCVYRMGRLISGLFIIMLLEKDRIIKAKAFFMGCKDAITNTMGPCKRALNGISN